MNYVSSLCKRLRYCWSKDQSGSDAIDDSKNDANSGMLKIQTNTRGTGQPLCSIGLIKPTTLVSRALVKDCFDQYWKTWKARTLLHECAVLIQRHVRGHLGRTESIKFRQEVYKLQENMLRSAILQQQTAIRNRLLFKKSVAKLVHRLACNVAMDSIRSIMLPGAVVRVQTAFRGHKIRNNLPQLIRFLKRRKQFCLIQNRCRIAAKTIRDEKLASSKSSSLLVERRADCRFIEETKIDVELAHTKRLALSSSVFDERKVMYEQEVFDWAAKRSFDMKRTNKIMPEESVAATRIARPNRQKLRLKYPFQSFHDKQLAASCNKKLTMVGIPIKVDPNTLKTQYSWVPAKYVL